MSNQWMLSMAEDHGSGFALHFTDERTRWKSWVDERVKRKNKTMSKVRANVEHVSAMVKRQ